jgi:hypothetical protein
MDDTKNNPDAKAGAPAALPLDPGATGAAPQASAQPSDPPPPRGKALPIGFAEYRVLHGTFTVDDPVKRKAKVDSPFRDVSADDENPVIQLSEAEAAPYVAQGYLEPA